MRTFHVLKLTAASLLLFCGTSSCLRKKGIDVSRPTPQGTPSQGFKLTPEQQEKLLETHIPLDALDVKEPLLLRPVEAHEEVGQTMPGQLGLEKQWAFVDDNVGLNALKDTEPVPSREQFPGYAIVSESSPQGARADASKRVFNLPDLLERLVLESPSQITGVDSGGLPRGVQVLPSSDTTLTVVVTAPTVLSASFSTQRTVRILNRSKLVLLVPLAENVIVQQEKPLSGEEPHTEVHSYTCVRIDPDGFEGTAQHLNLGNYTLGSTEQCAAMMDARDPRVSAPTESKLMLEAWMPQLLLTTRIRGESIVKSAKRWAPLYRVSSLKFFVP